MAPIQVPFALPRVTGASYSVVSRAPRYDGAGAGSGEEFRFMFSQSSRLAALGPLCLAAAIGLGATGFAAAQTAARPRDAEPATRAANEAVARSLPFADTADFADAERGFVAAIPDGLVPGSGAWPVWNMKAYAFLDAPEPPPSVNPSLWRQARINYRHGLFKVAERVYQIRGLDLANMTIVETDTGLFVIDPLLSVETAKAGLALYYAHRPRRPVVAVAYSHSHVDHFGGVRGVVSEEDVRSGKIVLIAPDGFMKHAVSENIIAGNAMTRRAVYMYGTDLPPGEKGHVDNGLGKSLSRGTITLIAPNDHVVKPTETRTIDGLAVEFVLVPGAEAPAEMVMYFPQLRLLDTAEITSRHMHNLYTLRGAEIRDGRAWSKHIGALLDRFADKTDILIAQHHWPTFGQERVAAYLARQRDLYKFVHDQSVRLLNHGSTPTEIAARLAPPKSLASDWSSRGYYGTLSHNAKAVYQQYLGWYDANPANLDPLPPVDSARRTIAYMGGAEAVLARARKDFAAGDYRWVASVMNQLVFAEPGNTAARELGADALEQLGYQSESGPWRNAYLTGAMELRNNGPKPAEPRLLTRDLLQALSTDMLFDFIAVRLDAAKAEGKRLVINWTFTDVGEKFAVNLENSALTHVAGKLSSNADVSFTLTRSTFDAIILKQRTFAGAVMTGDLKFWGNPLKLQELMAMLDEFTPTFPIVTPKKAAE